MQIQNQMRSIRMQILTIQKGFEAFEPFQPNSNANSNPSNEIWNIRMQILSMAIRKGFKAFEPFQPNSKDSNANSNPSNEIWNIQKQILAIRTRFETFESRY